jgi:hypothetical protein
MKRFQKRLWTGICLMALLSPLGVIIPMMMNAETAWGEWSTETLEKLLGYVPSGLKDLADIWKAPVPDYNLGGEEASLWGKIFSYIISALTGILVVTAVIYLVGRLNGKSHK